MPGVWNGVLLQDACEGKPNAARSLRRVCGRVKARSAGRVCLPGDYSDSISLVICAVFCSMADTEQYFSFDSRTASSTALRETLPPTR